MISITHEYAKTHTFCDSTIFEILSSSLCRSSDSIDHLFIVTRARSLSFRAEVFQAMFLCILAQPPVRPQVESRIWYCTTYALLWSNGISYQESTQFGSIRNRAIFKRLHYIWTLRRLLELKLSASDGKLQYFEILQIYSIHISSFNYGMRRIVSVQKL